MSDYSRFIAWDARCTDRGGYGMTPGDTMYLGLRDYNEMYPCPNGLPVQTGGPQNSEHWRSRVASAKRFIDQWNLEIQMQSVVWTEADLTELVKIGANADVE